MQYKLLDVSLSKHDVKFYETIHKGFTINKNKILQVNFDNGMVTKYIIFKGKYTKQYMCRECEEYYELSTGNSIIKIQKDEITV